MKRSIPGTFKLLICVALLILFSTGFTHQVSAAESTNPYGAAPIDPPGKNEVILVVKNKSQKNAYRFADLMALKLSTMSIYEPFLKKRQKFSGIALKELFQLAHISPSQKIETKALNDYIYANTASEFIGAQGFLAIKRDGRLIPYDQGGPIRIIFPTGSKWSHFLDPWNWSLSSIEAK